MDKKISLQTYKTLGKKSNQKSHIKDKQKNQSSQHEHWKIKDTVVQCPQNSEGKLFPVKISIPKVSTHVNVE